MINVASNTSANANAGVYLRPWHDDFRQLQTGLSVSWMNFSKNLSYFTYGQGGYFSPQNYVSVSLPVSLTEKYDNWTMKLGGSVGYQSYSQDKSAYFPTNAEWQQTLETAVSNGFAKEAVVAMLRDTGIDGGRRGETLSLADFASLTNCFKEVLAEIEQ